MIVLVVTLLLTLGAAATGPDLDAQVRAIADRLMCPVCQGRTVAESTSALAAQMRALIREKLRRGETAEEIVAYFRDRYGDTILAAPPREGLAAVAWALPVLAVAIGTVIVGWLLRAWTRPPGPGSTLPRIGMLPEEALRRVEEEVARLESGDVDRSGRDGG